MKKKIIFDHDLGSDCDDGAAGVILARAVKNGLCDALAVTHSVGNPHGQYVMESLFEYFGVRDNIPFGYLFQDVNADDTFHGSTKRTAEMYYLEKGRPYPERQSNVKVFRKVLAENNAKDIILVSTGPFTSLRELYESGPDEISPKTGIELVKENICLFCCAAGCFTSSEVREWNIRADVESAFEVLNNSPIPITYFGNNVGGAFMTGQDLPNEPEDYPLRNSYMELHNFSGESARPSWDLVVMYYAIYGESGFWTVKEGYDVKVNELGQTTFKEGGIHSYIEQVQDTQPIQDLMNEQISSKGAKD